MKVSYDKLWELLLKRGLKKKDLQQMTGFSSRTMAKLAHNENVVVDVLVKICEALGNCSVEEIVEFIPSTSESSVEEVENPSVAKQPEGFTFIDLFAGIGGIRIAFTKVGNKCVFSSEWDAAAQKTYEANYHEKPHGDITKISPEEIPDFDILTGGFPCQPFSMIGKREGFNHKTQGTLFFYIAEILRIKQPNAFLLENVPGLVTHDNGNTFKVILDTLDELGYKVYSKVLNSADYGLPQYRKRIYIVGFKKSLDVEFDFPEGSSERVGIGQFVEKDAEGPSISEHLQKSYIFKKDDGHPEIIDCNSDFPVKTLCASYHKIQRITSTFVRGGKTGLRLLTENECKAIMGFPKDFIIPVSRTQMYRQFGNSVAVPVVTAIAEKMTTALKCATK
jgi:DNA (cytosine-5)-methyltransferase 1